MGSATMRWSIPSKSITTGLGGVLPSPEAAAAKTPASGSSSLSGATGEACSFCRTTAYTLPAVGRPSDTMPSPSSTPASVRARNHRNLPPRSKRGHDVSLAPSVIWWLFSSATE